MWAYEQLHYVWPIFYLGGSFPTSFSLMTHSIDLPSIDQLHVSASQGQHSHVIEQSIVISQGLMDLHLNVLDMRARSYVACAQFEKALETATTMQQMYQSLAPGYLCQGYIHMEQGRCIAACDVYNAALERVDKNDPSYDTIKAMKTIATEQAGKRNLPIDIALLVIRQLLLIYSHYCEQLEYIMVSSNWYHRFMASRDFRYTLTGTIPLDETNSRVIESLRHVRLLEFQYYKPSFYHLFEKYQFTRLTQLIVHGLAMTSLDQTMLALKFVGKRLTNLTLSHLMSSMDYHRETRIRLQHILATCPNLVSLDLHGNIDIPTIDDTYPKLKELTLYHVIGTVDNQHMRMIQQHLPGLKTLYLSISDSSRPLTIKDTWMPANCHLGYGDPPSYEHKSCSCKEPGYQGLVSFSITRTNHLFALDHVASLIIYHHATLQFLELTFDFNTTFTNASNSQQHIVFKELETLLVNGIARSQNMYRY
ncbi:hypothetical protein K492DRAFT_222500 [Lichtheimia hyalospora FSU 10163]|nr:hypothetical protein K492DRAFT_222500 [Lichtheimia hyalospora FSU 10163]